ncbi:MAG: hypothetical protein QOK19_1591 [Solirubrobacteraceae bacterium]|jgi:hypothetical protein|nr:hypothetical protein [Solirubrobacteraceae bacterium]
MSAERRSIGPVARRCAALAAVSALALAVHAAPAPAGGTGGGRQARPSSLYPGPSVSIMVVGAGNVILVQPEQISVAATAVSTSHGTCGIAAATALAALVDLRRVGGPPFSIRDYGHCTSSPRNSGQLFVYSLDGETNHGQNGWEYKVDNRSGTTGAGDTSGPQGNGRLLANGARVLWFWCQSFGGGCQRTLEVRAPATVARGSAMSVSVVGYDNAGHARSMPGARVWIGASAAVTGSSGTATLRAPSKTGPLGVRASRPGSVPSFPDVVQVR